jgi:hypothetical protein
MNDHNMNNMMRMNEWIRMRSCHNANPCRRHDGNHPARACTNMCSKLHVTIEKEPQINKQGLVAARVCVFVPSTL